MTIQSKSGIFTDAKQLGKLRNYVSAVQYPLAFVSQNSDFNVSDHGERLCSRVSVQEKAF